MKSRVNLLQPQYKPEYRLVTLPFCYTVWGLTAVLMLAVGWSVSATLELQKSKAKTVLQQHRQQQSLVETLQSQQGLRKRDPALERRLQSLQSRLSQRQVIASQLAQQQSTGTQGFAPLLQAFAEEHLEGVWLTRIRQHQQRLMLEGGAKDTALMADWLVGLKDNQHFVGRTFEDARLYRDDGDQLRFSVGTLKESAEGQEVSSGG